MTESTRICTEFFISGDHIDPDVITRDIRLTPTSHCVKGQKREGKRPRAPTGEWGIETAWMRILSLDDGVDALMSVIWPQRDAVRRVASQTGVQVGVASIVEVFDERPVYGLSHRNIQRLAELGADYSLDLYDFRAVETLPTGVVVYSGASRDRGRSTEKGG